MAVGRVCWLGVAALVFAGIDRVPALAADGSPSVNDVRQKLEMQRSQLDATRERAKFIQTDVADIKKERERLNASLLETAALIQTSESRMSGIEGKLAGMEKQESALRSDLSANHDKIAKLMAALQRMGRNPPPVLFTQRQDALQMVRSAMLLAFAFPELRNDALGLATKLNELINIVADIRAERDSLKTETARLADSRVRLSALIETKRQTLNERQSELEKVRAAAAEISRSVTDLNELIGKLDQAVTSSTGLGAYNTEIAAAPPLAAPAAPASPLPSPAEQPATPPAVSEPPREVAVLTPPPAPIKPSPIKPSVIELRPATAAASRGNLDRFKPEVAFHLAKLRLPLPAQGRRVITFGDKTQYGGLSKGIVIETRPAAQITSPCDGWIVYAGEFHSYGQLLIINAGDGYHVLLAGLSQIDAQPGQFVLAAEPVGTMSGPAASSQAALVSGKTQTNSPVLYVEFRKDGRPIDPDPWWAEGHQKVQG